MTKRPVRETSRALTAGAAEASRDLKSKPRWFAKTGAIAIAAIGMLRSAAKAIASVKAATATIGVSPPRGVEATHTMAVAK